MTLLVAAVAIGYALGSIPTGWLVYRSRSPAGGDIRQQGSGNIGAANVLRTLGVRASLLTLAGDAAKGALAVGLARQLGPSALLASAAALAAVAGHVFPVSLRFRGGKGVATGFGAFALLAPLETALAALVFAVVVAAWRYVSLASCAAFSTLASLVVAADRGGAPAAAACLVLALILWRHRQNLARLRGGDEPRLGARS